MKYLVLVFCLGLSVFTSGCTKGCSTASVGCSIETALANGVGNAISNELQCSNTQAIQSDLLGLTGKLNLCKDNTVEMDGGKPKIPGVVCSIFADLIVNGIAGTAIPASWQCSATNAKALLKGVVVGACQKI